MPTPVLILGTRLLALDVMDLIGDMPGYEVAGFVENMNRELVGTTLEGLPVHWVDELPKFARTHVGVCALSTTQRQRYIEQATALGLRFETLVHPTARVSRRATLAPGCFVSALVNIAAFSALGQCVLVNRSAMIGHHTSIGDYSTIGPSASIAGAVSLGANVYVGIGATVLDRKAIGAGAVVAAGAVVTQDVPAHTQVMGVPARVTKTGIEAK